MALPSRRLPAQEATMNLRRRCLSKRATGRAREEGVNYKRQEASVCFITQPPRRFATETHTVCELPDNKSQLYDTTARGRATLLMLDESG